MDWKKLLVDQNLDFFSALEILTNSGYKLIPISNNADLVVIHFCINRCSDFILANIDIDGQENNSTGIIWSGSIYVVADKR